MHTWLRNPPHARYAQCTHTITTVFLIPFTESKFTAVLTAVKRLKLCVELLKADWLEMFEVVVNFI